MKMVLLMTLKSIEKISSLSLQRKENKKTFLEVYFFSHIGNFLNEAH